MMMRPLESPASAAGVDCELTIDDDVVNVGNNVNKVSIVVIEIINIPFYFYFFTFFKNTSDVTLEDFATGIALGMKLGFENYKQDSETFEYLIC